MAEKILIVDDDADTVKFLNTMLTRLGYETSSARNGMEALEVAHKEHPDLIILDVMMPVMDGFEVARSLRRHPETAVTPILMFTAKAGVDDKITGYDSGVNIYLTKPILPVELYANIKSVLAQHKSQVESQAKKGYMVGVLAAKGGLGVSTVALNLAIAYHQKFAGEEVVAAELRPCQGSWGADLNLDKTDGLRNLLSKNVAEINQALVNEQLAPTLQGVRLLLASNQSKDSELITAIGQLAAIIQQLAFIGALVVLDIGTTYHPACDMIVDQCNELILITEPIPNTVQRTHALARELNAKGFGRTKALNIILLNRTRSDLVLTLSQVETMLGQPVALGFPPANELAYRAIEKSLPLIGFQPEGMIAKQFGVLADQVKQHMTSK